MLRQYDAEKTVFVREISGLDMGYSANDEVFSGGQMQSVILF